MRPTPDLLGDPADAELPARFFAAWNRRELVVNDVAANNAGRAVWVQAGARFVDVRGPGGFASDTCFAGTTKWSDPHLTWTHVIDLADDEGEDGVDQGHIAFDGDELIESGGFIAGAAREYRERWTPLPGPRTPVLAATSADGICVRVGDHAAAVVDQRPSGGSFTAAYWLFDGEIWQVELAIKGDATRLPRPLEPGAVLDDGWEWEAGVEVRT